MFLFSWLSICDQVLLNFLNTNHFLKFHFFSWILKVRILCYQYIYSIHLSDILPVYSENTQKPTHGLTPGILEAKKVETNANSIGF